MFRSLCKSGPQLKCTLERYHVNGPPAFVPTGILKLRPTRQWAFYSKVFQTYLPRKYLDFRNPKRIWKRIYIYSTKQSNETHFHNEKLFFQKYDFSYIQSCCPCRVGLGAHGAIQLPLDASTQNLTLEVFRKTLPRTVLLKSDKNLRYFTCRPTYTYDNTSPISSYNEKYFTQEFQRISEHIIYIQQLFFPQNFAVYEIMWQI